MAIATVAPVVWGVSTGRAEVARWIALSAGCICWAALKGTPAQRTRILLGGTFLTLLFGALGSITGASFWWSVGFIAVVGFLAMLFRNLGDRGSGLSLCLYVMFLIANAHPVAGEALRERLCYILTGGGWSFLLGLATIAFQPVQQPYRRTIALIWQASATLMATIEKGWNGKGLRSTGRAIYRAEKSVREAIDTSFAFHERTVHQTRKSDDPAEAQLAQVRKSAAMVAANMIAMAGELESLRLQSVPKDLQLRLYGLMHSVQCAAGRMAAVVLTRRSEELLLMEELLDGIARQAALLRDYHGAAPLNHGRIVRRILQLSERCARLMAHSIEGIQGITEQTALRSYSTLKTLYVLHPHHWWRNIRLLFNLDSHTARYAVRTALAAGIAMSIYKWARISHGYWLPLTVLIVVQPYFAATIRKAIDRTIGTVAGGITGGLLLLLPAALHLKEVMLFLSAMAMIYFFRARYRISAFFITLNLVLLFSVSQELNKQLILLRAGLTVVGAIIAVGAGFVLLPTWDKRWLPRYMARALERNWAYFRQTFLTGGLDAPQWTRYKRQAEVGNSNAFDSFNRAVQEPRGLQREYARYYQLIAHNVQVTRELNNMHIEEEEKDVIQTSGSTGEVAITIQQCTEMFLDILTLVGKLNGRAVEAGIKPGFSIPDVSLNTPQKLCLERLVTELRLLKETLEGLLARNS